MTIVERFRRHLANTPDKIAVRLADSEVSYAELADRAERLCSLLHDMGVTADSRILVVLDNGLAFVETVLATAAIGAAVAPVSPSLAEPGLAAAAGAVDADFAVAGSAAARRLLEATPLPAANILVVGSALSECRNHADIVAAAPHGILANSTVDPDSVFLLTMTSGSTGEPKPIVLTQAGKVHRAIDGASELYRLDADDVIVTATPMYHSLGFRLALLPLLIGAQAVIMTSFTAQAYVDAVDRHRVTFSIVVSSQLPAILDALDAQNGTLPSLRTLVSSSALLPPALMARCVAQLGCDFHECYGASEVGIVTDIDSRTDDRHGGSVGRALDYVDLKIVDATGRTLPSGEIGEIYCRTRTAFAGYFRQPQLTAASLHDGYFATGDLGYLDADGYLYLAGRKKDVIIVGGTNVYPEDVEAVLRAAPGVRDCAVIGVPDSYFGEAVLACVVAGDDCPPERRRLQAHCVRRLADYQVPLAYEFVDRMPRTDLGKIRRQALRERFRGYDASAELRRLRGAVQYRA
ncbi:MAG: class I adenylate-forming enzyme family protein [Gammaproteobacteria bacterium]|nr:class I adenylate-forming enzyme family protein [Gammaproteobacteria bacterium]